MRIYPGNFVNAAGSFLSATSPRFANNWQRGVLETNNDTYCIRTRICIRISCVQRFSC